MAKRAFVVTGLGYGDEGKGTVTHWLSSRYKAHTVLRFGGPQALHRSVCTNGKEFIFSQLGSGTLRGAATHLSHEMMIDPHALLKEGEAFMYEHGIRGIFESMTIHQDALVITPFQAIAGRLRELMRGKHRHGSVGIGVGETILDAEIIGDGAIRAGDLSRSDLVDKLMAIRQRKLAEFEELRDRASFVPVDIRKEVRLEISELEDMDTVQWAIERFSDLAKRVKIVDTDYVATKILHPNGTIIFEGSQGALLDRWYGFCPYTTKVRTIPEGALRIIKECEYDGEVKNFGVLRAYHTRHGNGPFVSESSLLTERLPDQSNKHHAWQGNFRVGYFDAVAARYAIAAAGRASLDGLIVTCADRIHNIRPNNSWEICNSYTATKEVLANELFFQSESWSIKNIIPNFGKYNKSHLKRQEKLGRFLQQCRPELTAFKLPADGKKALANFCATTLKTLLGVPVFAVSMGETEVDKLII